MCSCLCHFSLPAVLHQHRLGDTNDSSPDANNTESQKAEAAVPTLPA
jgi:hypothetical protein